MALENTAIYRTGATLALDMAAGACSAAASALKGAVRACFGAASALEMAAPVPRCCRCAALACSGGASALRMVTLAGSAFTSALKKTFRARFGAASAFKAAVPGSLFENAGLGYTVL